MEFWKLQGHFQEYEIILKQPRIAYMRPKNWRLRHAAQENNHYRIIDLKKDNTFVLKYLLHTMTYNEGFL